MNNVDLVGGFVFAYLLAEMLRFLLTQSSVRVTIYYHDDNKLCKRMIVNCLGSEPGCVFLKSMMEQIVRDSDDDASCPEVDGLSVEYLREWRWVKPDKTFACRQGGFDGRL